MDYTPHKKKKPAIWKNTFVIAVVFTIEKSPTKPATSAIDPS